MCAALDLLSLLPLHAIATVWGERRNAMIVVTTTTRKVKQIPVSYMTEQIEGAWREIPSLGRGFTLLKAEKLKFPGSDTPFKMVSYATN